MIFAPRIVDHASLIPFPFELQALALVGPFGPTLVPSLVKASPSLYRVSASTKSERGAHSHHSATPSSPAHHSFASSRSGGASDRNGSRSFVT